MSFLLQSWSRLLHTGFYLLYHQLAPNYDLISWIVSLGRWRKWQTAALPFLQGKHVLELAHGPGHMLIALQQAGYTVTGIDLSPQMIKLARSRIAVEGNTIRILQCPAQRLPFAANSFDSVLATFPTEFIVDRRCLDEVQRVLHTGGRLVIVPQARLIGRFVGLGFLEFLFRITGQRGHPGAYGNEGESFRQWRMYEEHFRGAGFEPHTKVIRLPRSEVIVIVAEKLIVSGNVACQDPLC